MNKIIKFFKELFKPKPTKVITIDLAEPIYFIPEWDKNELEKIQVDIHETKIHPFKNYVADRSDGFTYTWNGVVWIAKLLKDGLHYTSGLNDCLIQFLSNDKYELLDVDKNCNYSYRYVINGDSVNYYISKNEIHKLDFESGIGLASDRKTCILAKVNNSPDWGIGYSELSVGSYLEVFPKDELEVKSWELKERRMKRFDNL